MKYALIKDSIVKNIIISEPDYISNLTGYDYIIDVTEMSVKMDDIFDGVNFTTPIVEKIPVIKQFTQLEFQTLFTLDELVAIEVAAESNPTLKVLQRMQQSATYIILTDSRTIQSLQLLVQLSLLTQVRYDEILTHTYV